MNRGGSSCLSLEQLTAKRTQLSCLFSVSARRRSALSTDETIGGSGDPTHPGNHSSRNFKGQNPWTFPDLIFSEATRLRNWLMFEAALQLGVRRGELLKLRLDSLPRGSDDGIRILRSPDDPADTQGERSEQ